MNVYRIYLFNGWFDFTPLLLFVSDKKGENIVLLFTLTPLLMIDKRGGKYLSLNACLLVICKFISKFVSYWYQESLFDVLMFCWYWYQEHGQSRTYFVVYILLISRTFIKIFIVGIKNFYWLSFNWYQEFFIDWY